ncbi:hypothetical protein OG594_42860 [Streptomyces sp. NBC_01214]|uniref:hypothetical protein n=1 Tax=Streptomyces sp. NBC_01214 TaxID=2903777 RepID=UPI00225BB8C3|nr:hypothetical protein [Streptomyces sp. NBC_01214]MCX4808255.1 hypothetical protein [Streptomyces sp. NBC_01214]
MVVGQMRFGTSQNAGEHETSLENDRLGKTLVIVNRRNQALPPNGHPMGVGACGIGQLGCWGVSHTYGVQGLTLRDGAVPTGVVGYGQAVNNSGVMGQADRGAIAYGIWGRSVEGYAGYFSGKVHVEGALTKGSGGFKIDHPLDPENKYLVHSFVESPDMLNVYSGNVETDDNGDAVVPLPSYFDALNQDFAYQLTCIGQFAQAIVAEEVDKNQFSIRTDAPNVKVSWQVTGVRKDPYAAQNRIIPEEDKPEEERGLYLYPESYHQPRSRHINSERELAQEANQAQLTVQAAELLDRYGTEKI